MVDHIMIMEKEFEQLNVDFNNQASKIFFSLYERFRNNAQRLNRQKDENVFQQQLSKYLFTLKGYLEAIVKELIYKNRPLKNTDRLKKMLTDEINDYLNEFKQKSNSL